MKPFNAERNSPVSAAAAGFMALFPIFAFYHTAVAFDVIPPIFGGMFGSAAAATMITFALLSYRWIPLLIRSDVRFTASVVLLLAYAFSWSLLNYVFQHDSAEIDSAFFQSMTLCCLWLALFLVGHFLPFESRTLFRVVLFFFLIALAGLLFFTVSTGSIMFYAKALSGDAENVATYQGFARSALVTLLFLLAAAQRMLLRIFLATAGLFIMFILGARSELFAFVLSLTALGVWWSLTNARYAAAALSIALITPVIAIIGFDHFAHSRHGQILDLSSASSWVVRKQFEDVAVSQIAGSPIFGFFGGHVFEGEGTGSYAHNILSAWANFGIMGMILYFFPIAWVAIGSVYHVLVRRRTDPCIVFAFSLGIPALALSILTKSIFWGLPAITWGAYAQFLYRKRSVGKANSTHIEGNACT